jgi:hypothetical protein
VFCSAAGLHRVRSVLRISRCSPFRCLSLRSWAHAELVPWEGRALFRDSHYSPLFAGWSLVPRCRCCGREDQFSGWNRRRSGNRVQSAPLLARSCADNSDAIGLNAKDGLGRYGACWIWWVFLLLLVSSRSSSLVGLFRVPPLLLLSTPTAVHMVMRLLPMRRKTRPAAHLFHGVVCLQVVEVVTPPSRSMLLLVIGLSLILGHCRSC